MIYIIIIERGGITLRIDIKQVTDQGIEIAWKPVPGADAYRVYWTDKHTKTAEFRLLGETGQCGYQLNKTPHVSYGVYVEAVSGGRVIDRSPAIHTPITRKFREQREKLDRGLIAIRRPDGMFVSWRLFLEETNGYSDTGMTGADFALYRDGERIALVTDSTNFLDAEGTMKSRYQVAPVTGGKEGEKCPPVVPWKSGLWRVW